MEMEDDKIREFKRGDRVREREISARMGLVPCLFFCSKSIALESDLP